MYEELLGTIPTIQPVPTSETKPSADSRLTLSKAQTQKVDDKFIISNDNIVNTVNTLSTASNNNLVGCTVNTDHLLYEYTVNTDNLHRSTVNTDNPHSSTVNTDMLLHKPCSTDPRSYKEQYILAKYCNKTFVNDKRDIEPNLQQIFER